MLKVEALQASYGQSQVLFDVGIEVNRGEMVTLLGRNGMGKTTTIRAIMGMTPPHGGTVTFEGKSLRGLSSFRIAKQGLGLVPEGRCIFASLTVWENLTATATSGPLGRLDHAGDPRAVSLDRRTPSPDGRPAFWRRAANVGNRPRAYDQSGTTNSR
jgi:ABC-type branched-subunit amino acid transport system ATPase component